MSVCMGVSVCLCDHVPLCTIHISASHNITLKWFTCYFTGADRGWDNWVTKGCSRWTNSIINWLYVYKGPILVVEYEELKKDVAKQLQHMLDFLEHPYTDRDIQCVLNKQMETFHRHKDRQFDPFTVKQRKFIQTSILKVAKLLSRYDVNYKDWL